MKLNKNIAILIAIVATLALGGAVIAKNNIGSVAPNFSQQTKITMEQARKIALEKASGKIEGEELEKENGKLIYSFDIRNKKGTITEVQVDAYTGAIVSVEEEDAAAEAAEKRNEKNEDNEMNEQDNDDDESPAMKNARMAKLAKDARITMEQARAFALARVPGTITEEDLEMERGKLQYAFDIKDANGKIFDVEIDAKTGEVLKANLDDEDDEDDDGGNSMSANKMGRKDSDEDNQAELMKQAKITKADAEKIALKKANGKVEEGELEMENGKLVYSFDIRNKKGTITEVQVDAKSGKIVSVEEEDAAKEAAEKKQEMMEKKTKPPKH